MGSGAKAIRAPLRRRGHDPHVLDRIVGARDQHWRPLRHKPTLRGAVSTILLAFFLSPPDGLHTRIAGAGNFTKLECLILNQDFLKPTGIRDENIAAEEDPGGHGGVPIAPNLSRSEDQDDRRGGRQHHCDHHHGPDRDEDGEARKGPISSRDAG